MEGFWLSLYQFAWLALGSGFVGALVAICAQGRAPHKDAPPDYQIPPHLEELAARLGYDRRGFLEGEALSRRINDELRDLQARADKAEAALRDRRSDLVKDAKAQSERLKGWTYTPWVIHDFPSFDGTLPGDKQWDA